MNPENEIDKTEALEPVETAAANVAEARGGVDGRKRPKWLLPLIAVVCAVVLVVAGVVGWNMYRGAKLAISIHAPQWGATCTFPSRMTSRLFQSTHVFCQVGVGRFGVSFSPCERRVSGRFGVGRSCWLLVIALVIA